jgi:RHS repeat-associated protein
VSSAEACFDILGAAPRGASYDHLYDRLGSTRQLLDSNQATTDTYSYYAFGEVRTSSGSTTNPFKFVGRLGYYDDPSADLQYLRARYYAPGCGRFLTRDPLVARWPSYVYADNSPAGRVDSSGEVWSVVDPQCLQGPWGVKSWDRILERICSTAAQCIGGQEYSRLASCMQQKCSGPIHIHCRTQASCRALGHDACAFAPCPGNQITLCEDALNEALCDSLANTILHEMVHGCGQCDESVPNCIADRCFPPRFSAPRCPPCWIYGK